MKNLNTLAVMLAASGAVDAPGVGGGADLEQLANAANIGANIPEQGQQGGANGQQQGDVEQEDDLTEITILGNVMKLREVVVSKDKDGKPITAMVLADQESAETAVRTYTVLEPEERAREARSIGLKFKWDLDVALLIEAMYNTTAYTVVSKYKTGHTFTGTPRQYAMKAPTKRERLKSWTVAA